MKLMRLTDILELTGTLELVTGLYIGGGRDEMHIGGSDNPVICHPHTGVPYIPGSSLKGKIRSLLEWRAGVAALNGGKPMSCAKLGDAPDRDEALMILKLFGVPGGDGKTVDVGPTRVRFRDCPLKPDWLDQVKARNLLVTEIKMENTIDRVRGVAEHPRNFERVPAGASFDFSMSVQVLDGEDLLETILTGLRLLELDSLGGSGSRGYGRVKFTGLIVKRGDNSSEPLQERLDSIRPFAPAV